MSENPELLAVARSLAQHRKRFEAFTLPATASSPVSSPQASKNSSTWRAKESRGVLGRRDD